MNASVAGHIAFEPKPSASRWYGVRPSVAPSPGEDGQDRHGLAELAQAGDQAAARERDVVRMRRDEDMGHGRPSIPSGTGRRRSAGRGQPVEPARADERDEDAVAVGLLEPFVAVPGDDGQQLAVARPDRDDQPAAVGELVAQLLRDRPAPPR